MISSSSSARYVPSCPDQDASSYLSCPPYQDIADRLQDAVVGDEANATAEEGAEGAAEEELISTDIAAETF